MGILINAFSIISGSMLGSVFKERIQLRNFTVLSISIMIISLAGFFENVFDIAGKQLESTNLMVVVFSLIAGSFAGDALRLDQKLSKVTNAKSNSSIAFIDSALFFGIGGLQISGSVLLAIENDSGQLILKSLIDFPFALMFGMSYGKIASLSAIPVAAMQVLIASVTYAAGSFFDDRVVGQMCAMGYIVLFFSGFNLICDNKNKINSINMLPGILIIIIINLFLNLRGLVI